MKNTGAILILGLLLIVLIYSHLQRTKPAPIYTRKKLLGGYNARTIPPFGIYVAEPEAQNEALIDHELTHWNQFQRMGLFGFYASYFGQKLRHGYDRMPMEVEARADESPYCKHNYTHCVRTGQSATVFNPNFRI